MPNRADNFNRANGSIGTPSDAGSAWSVLAGTWTVASNAGSSGAGGGNDAAVLESSLADVDVSAIFPAAPSAAGRAGLVLRATDANNFIAVFIRQGATSLVLRRRQDGSNTDTALTALASAPGAGDKLRVVARGGVFDVYYTPSGSAEVQKASGVAEAFNQTATKHGLYTSFGTATFDDFAASAYATPLSAGTLDSTGHTDTTADLTWTAATGGVAPVTAQLQRSPAGAGTWSNVSGATSSPATDAGLTASTSYDYRVAYADAQPTSANSNTVTVTTDAAAGPQSGTLRVGGRGGTIFFAAGRLTPVGIIRRDR